MHLQLIEAVKRSKASTPPSRGQAALNRNDQVGIRQIAFQRTRWDASVRKRETPVELALLGACCLPACCMQSDAKSITAGYVYRTRIIIMAPGRWPRTHPYRFVPYVWKALTPHTCRISRKSTAAWISYFHLISAFFDTSNRRARSDFATQPACI